VRGNRRESSTGLAVLESGMASMDEGLGRGAGSGMAPGISGAMARGPAEGYPMGGYATAIDTTPQKVTTVRDHYSQSPTTHGNQNYKLQAKSVFSRSMVVEHAEAQGL
jgi:hypothetical protein